MRTPEGKLAEHTRESVLGERLDGNRVRCLACAHRCRIAPGFAGVCKVRFNRDGKLYAPYGYVSGIHCDPIEKKPFFHVRPGCGALSFGMLGCDLHCGYCQNWLTSQALRDQRSTLDFVPVEPRTIVDAAITTGADVVVSTYNEPLITAEWAVEVFHLAHQAGLLTGLVSNGNATREVLQYLRPYVDLYKVDLKSFNDRRYRELGGRLGPILDAIALIHEMGFWLEIVTLVVPDFNDSDAELWSIARFIEDLSGDIPWHVSAFRPQYKMMSGDDTPVATVMRAYQIGRNAGLHFVYTGNLSGVAGAREDTFCPVCDTPLIRRHGFHILESRVGKAGVCPACHASIPGVWAGALAESVCISDATVLY
jgi:pyruvate formate lyase activating enzyme